MKKQDLLHYFDNALLEKLYGFCYARTKDSHEAQDLCSDIVYALMKAARSEEELESVYPFIWRVARNVYADFVERKGRHAKLFWDGDADEILPYVSDDDEEDDTEALLSAVYRRIAFLTKAYREVMILFYLDGLSTAEIAKRQSTSETAIRQRLFSARQKIRSEVKEMKEAYNKPIALENMDYVIWGTGNPGWGDPRNGFSRMFSKHVVRLCHKKPMSAAEIAEELNVPTVYVEEELEILRRGDNGKYGLLRRLDNGKYAVNFILFDRETIEKAQALYTEHLPMICDTIADYIEAHKEEYLSFPYLNKKADLNLILWQQISSIADCFSYTVKKILQTKYFEGIEPPSRPFSVYGYIDNGKHWGGGWDGVDAKNVWGFSKIHLDNIYITRIKAHFHCGLNVSNNVEIQLALRAIEGLALSSLSEDEKEYAAKAIAQGYLYREGDMLYTKILVSAMKDAANIFDVSNRLTNGYFEKEAEKIAQKLAVLIKKSVPDYLLSEWRFANNLANMPILDSVVEALIEKGILTPPENGIGAEGCWMYVEKA
ncbi:MAG: RNA polymerase sigma factor [Clostridia bacterium]|nr:RNA polymerase sigma factor [Clostridia bacterium]